jgi:hypothetical protein
MSDDVSMMTEVAAGYDELDKTVASERLLETEGEVAVVPTRS